jgi:tetratricopeptide (TPR) repeat protein
MPSPQPSRWSIVLAILPAALIIVASATMLAFVLQVYFRRSEPAAAQKADPTAQVEVLRRQLDELRRDAGATRDLLTLLLVVGGFYTALQGLFNFYSAQNFTRQAESELGRIKEMMVDVQARFPMFGEIEKRRREAFEDLAATLPTDWRERGYLALDIETRQRIFSLESFVALEFSASPGQQDRVAQNLYNLGRFYRSKYVSVPSDQRDPFDLDRAEYYLRLALASAQRPHHVLNELGLIYLEFRKGRSETEEERSRRLSIATSYFDRSRRQNDRQQRALYNLALVEFQRKNYDAAQDLLETAVEKLMIWEDAPDEDMLGHSLYNLACTYSRKAEALHTVNPADPRVDELLRMACSRLMEAAAIGPLEEKAFMHDDLETGPPMGDLGFTQSREPFKTQALQAVKVFEERWAAREGSGRKTDATKRRSFKQRIAAYWASVVR